MELKAAKDILDFLKTDGHDFVTSCYSIVSKGKVAFESVDLRSTTTLTYAIRFMVYVAVISFVLEVPIAALVGLPYYKPAYVATNLTLILILWLSYAMVLHLSMKSLGGQAQLIQSMSIFCFLTAYFIPIMVVQWPLQKYLIPAIKESASIQPDWLPELSAVELVSIYTLALIQTFLFLYFLVIAFRVLRYVHKLSMTRALAGFMLGIIGMVLIVFLISLPMHHTIYNAFHG